MEEAESVSRWVERDGSERVDDEARMREMLMRRYGEKCRLARETFHWE